MKKNFSTVTNASEMGGMGVLRACPSIQWSLTTIYMGKTKVLGQWLWLSW